VTSRNVVTTVTVASFWNRVTGPPRTAGHAASAEF
jgi:hypothetical protein